MMQINANLKFLLRLSELEIFFSSSREMFIILELIEMFCHMRGGVFASILSTELT